MKALIAELLGGEIARVLDLPVPEIVFVELDGALAMTEPDPEIQDLIKSSAGVNLALDYLPGSIMFDTAIQEIDAELASKIVWFDAFTANVDRTPRNANMLLWHKKLWLIDHGAALYYHHNWDTFSANSRNPFAMSAQHILFPFASGVEKVDAELTAKLTPEILTEIVALIPDEWLDNPEEQRKAYLGFFIDRLKAPREFAVQIAAQKIGEAAV